MVYPTLCMRAKIVSYLFLYRYNRKNNLVLKVHGFFNFKNKQYIHRDVQIKSFKLQDHLFFLRTKDFSTEPNSSSDQDEIQRILLTLENKLIQLNLVNLDDVSNALDKLVTYKEALTAYDVIKISNIAYQAIQKERKSIVVTKFWKFLLSLNEIRIHPEVFKNVVQMCKISNDLLSPKDLISLLEQSETEVSQEIAETIFDYICHLGKKDGSSNSLGNIDGGEHHLEMKDDVEHHLPKKDGVEHHLEMKDDVEHHLPKKDGIEHYLEMKDGVEHHLPKKDGVEHHLANKEGVEHHVVTKYGVEDFLSYLKENHFEISEKILSSLIVYKGHIRDVHRLEETLQLTKDFKPSPLILSSKIQAYHACAEIDKARTEVNTAETSGIRFTLQQFSDLISSLVLYNTPSSYDDYLPYIMNIKNVIAADCDLNDLVVRLIQVGKAKEAVFILSTQKAYTEKSHLSSNCSHCIKEIVHSVMNPSEISSICLDIIDKNINKNALIVALEFALIAKKSETSWALLRTLKESGHVIREHYFWPLFIIGRTDSDCTDSTLQTIRGMLELGVQPSLEGLLKFIIPNLSLEAPDHVLLMLSKVGVGANKAIVPLILLLFKKELIDKVLNLINKVQMKIPIEPLIHKLVDLYVRRPEMTLKLLKALTDKSRANGADPKMHVDHFIRVFARLSTDGFSKLELIEKLTELDIPYSTENENGIYVKKNALSQVDMMNLDQLESHLVELKSKNMNTRGVLRKLLIKYSAVHNLEKVTQILEELKSIGGGISPGMLSSSLQNSILKKDIEESLQTLILLQKTSPNFAIDAFKILDLSTLLVQQNRTEDAIEILEKYMENLPVLSHGKNFVKRNCNRLLSAIAEAGNYEATRHVTSRLIEGGLADPSPVILGPRVKVLLKNGKVRGAVKEMEDLYTTYNVLPLRIEVLISLIEKLIPNKHYDCVAVNGELRWEEELEKVLTLIRRSRGEVQSKQDFLYATIEVGNKEEARKVFKSVESDLDRNRVRELCDFLLRKEKSECLLLLLSVSQGSSQVDRNYICHALMNIYYVAKDCKAALALWSRMQEEKLRPTPVFMDKMSKLLKNNAAPDSDFYK